MVKCPYTKDTCWEEDCGRIKNCRNKGHGGSGKPRPANILPFGKHKGKTVQEVVDSGVEGAEYLQWLLYKKLPEIISDPTNKFKSQNENLAEEIKKVLIPGTQTEIKTEEDNVPF